MLKVLLLKGEASRAAVAVAPGGISPFPILETNSPWDAAAQLRDDLRIAAIALGDDLKPAALELIARAIAERPMPLEVVWRGVTPDVPPALIVALERREILPWHCPPDAHMSVFARMLNQVLHKAIALRDSHEVRRGALHEGGFGGNSPEAQILAERVSRATMANTPLLISGPAGGGMQDLAHLVHTQTASRCRGPFIIVSSKEILAENFIARFFGSPAVPGISQLVSGGTVLLDGIEHLSPNCQMRLAEMHASGEFYRLGESQPEPCDFRMIATSSADLAGLTAAGHLRADLINQLSPHAITIPPLASRRGDIAALAVHFARQAWKDVAPDTGFPTFYPDALDLLAATDWPRDRESLRHFVVHFMLVCAPSLNRPITAKDLQPELEPWLRSAIQRTAEDEELKALRLVRVLGLDYDRVEKEMLYAYLTMMKRCDSKQQLADRFGKSARWLEITTNDLAHWFLESGLRTREELQRDGVWSRRFDTYEKNRKKE